MHEDENSMIVLIIFGYNIKMRFLEVIEEKSVPEWARCYYDYRTTKLIISLGKKARIILMKIRDQQKSLNVRTVSEIPEQENDQMKRLLDDNINVIYEIMEEANKLFFQYHQLNKMIVFLFSQMKVHELNSRLDYYEQWSPMVDTTEQTYIELLSNVFYEGKMLYNMCQLNLEAYKKIHRKHKKTFEGFHYFQLDSPPPQNMRIVRTLDQLNLYFDRLQTIYLMKKEVYPKRARDELQSQMEENPTYVAIASYLFGMANGISISLVIVTVILFSYNRITIDTTDVFKRDFPVWRGISYLIMYMWVMALNVVVFEKNKINYQLILKLGKMSSSSFLLSYASLFTFIFMTMFLLYVLDISQIITLGDGSEAPYLPLVVWGCLLGYILLPLPILNWHARWTLIKRCAQTVLSPIIGAPFYTIWIIQQLISGIQPFQDIHYTICYYTTLNLSVATSENHCQRNLFVGEMFGVTVFAYRFLQCMRVAWKNNHLLGTVQMYIAIRSVLNIIILLISFFSSENEGVRVLWYIMVGPILLYSYYVDLKHDWGLFLPNQYHPLLRRNIGYSPYLYYVIMILNLIFRAAWVATLSPTVLVGFNVQSYYFFYIIGTIEITRRLFWNLLKMENKHIRNVEIFRIRTDYQEKQNKVKRQVQQEGGQEIPEDEHQIMRRKEQLINIKSFLDIKDQEKKKIKELLEKKFEQLTQIEKSLQQLDKN